MHFMINISLDSLSLDQDSSVVVKVLLCLLLSSTRLLKCKNELFILTKFHYPVIPTYAGRNLQGVYKHLRKEYL